MHRTILVLVAIAVFLWLPTWSVYAQSEIPRYELGAQFSALRFDELDTTGLGIGGRFTYNISENVAVEGEINFFPDESVVTSGLLKGARLEGGRKLQGLFGVKAGMRRDKVGVFGKVRPGFVRFIRFSQDLPVCSPQPGRPCPRGPLMFISQTDFAIDLGGVVELYPSRRTVLRLDIGDTVIHPTAGRGMLIPFTAAPSTSIGFQPSVQLISRSISHNLQLAVGFAYRFLDHPRSLMSYPSKFLSIPAVTSR